MKARLALAVLSILLMGGSALLAEDLITEVRSPGGHYLFRIPDSWRVAKDGIQQQGESFQLVPVKGATLRGMLLPPAEKFDLAGEVKRDIVGLFRGLEWEGYEDPVATRVGGSEAARTSLGTRSEDGTGRHVVVVVTCGEKRLHLILSRVAGDATAVAEKGFEAFLRSARIPAGAEGAGANPAWQVVKVGDSVSFQVPGDWNAKQIRGAVHVRVPGGAGRVACFPGEPTPAGAPDPADAAAYEDGMLELDGWDVEQIGRRILRVSGAEALRIDRRLSSEGRKTEISRSLVFRVGDRCYTLSCSRREESPDAIDATFEQILGSVKIKAAGGGEGGGHVGLGESGRDVTMADGRVRFRIPANWKDRPDQGPELPGYESVGFQAPKALAIIIVKTVLAREDARVDELLDAQLKVIRERYVVEGEVERRRGQRESGVTLRADYMGVERDKPGSAPYKFRDLVYVGRGHAIILNLFDLEKSRTTRAKLDALFEQVLASLKVEQAPAKAPSTIHGTWVGTGKDGDGRGFDVRVNLKRDNTYTVGVRFHAGETQEFEGRWFKDATILRLISFDGQQSFYKYRLTAESLTLSSAMDDGSPSIRMTRER